MLAFLGGLSVTIICLGLQVISVVSAVRYVAARQDRAAELRTRLAILRWYATLMLLLMAGNIGQVMIWASLYQLLGAFPDFETAVYFSGITFTSLGNGDVLLQPPLRLLGPLQAANGLMMFGISTAAFMTIAQFSINKPHGPTRGNP
jgi:Ion channel